MKIGVPSMVEEVVASDFVSREVGKNARSLQRHDRKSKRELANRNERKRMKVINDGFQSLRKLLPFADDEKLSKAAILQRTVDYISQLLQERQKIMKHLDESNASKIFGSEDLKHREPDQSKFNKLQVLNGLHTTPHNYIGSYNGVMPSLPGNQETGFKNIRLSGLSQQQHIRISVPLSITKQHRPTSEHPIHFETVMETEHPTEEVVSSPSSHELPDASYNIGSLDVILRAIHSIEGTDSNELSTSNDEDSEHDSESDYAIASSN